MQSRFGEGSVEATSVLNALGAFRDGAVSKRDTVNAIKLVLSHHYDLKQALTDVLYHPAADWHPDDFEFGSPQPSHLTIPSFLQPVHQPQFHLPPTPWQQANTSQRLSYNQTWSSTPTEPIANYDQSPAADCPDISSGFPESLSPQIAFQETLDSETTMPSFLSASMPVSDGWLVEDMPPPSKKRRCGTFEDQILQHAIDHDSPETAEQIGLPTTNAAQPIVPSQRQSETRGRKAQDREFPKQFIHGLCGKGFVARCKVKKHHWGNVLNDLGTTTGCWAKHGKPDVSWDDHPSCKKTAKLPDHARTASPSSQTDGESQERSQTIPPIASIVEELRGATTYTTNTREDYQDYPQGTNRYHSHRLPHRSSFDALLHAANMMSQVDTTQAQGYTESLATQLDAHITAAERSRQYITGLQNDLGGYQSEAVAAHGYHHPYTTTGSDFLYPPRGHHVPLEVALPFYGRPQAHTPHMYPPTTGNSIDDPASVSNDAHSSRALLPPFSPDPYVRSRRVQDE